LLAFVSWAVAKNTLVGLLLIAYNGVGQFVPGIIFSICKRPPSALSIGTGIVFGIVFLCWCLAAKPSLPGGLNVGFVAMLINIVCVWVVDQVGYRLTR
jgi:hypothetical protein